MIVTLVEILGALTITVGVGLLAGLAAALLCAGAWLVMFGLAADLGRVNAVEADETDYSSPSPPA